MSVFDVDKDIYTHADDNFLTKTFVYFLLPLIKLAFIIALLPLIILYYLAKICIGAE